MIIVLKPTSLYRKKSFEFYLSEYGICISNTKLFSSNKSRNLYKKYPSINKKLSYLIEKYHI